MPGTFISYRISDSRDLVGRLDADLTREFGHDTVFRDKTRLQAGQVWTEVLEQEARGRPVMLVVIGPTWESAAFPDGPRKGFPRLSDPDDWVRKEITLGLNAGNLVIPLLLNGTPMPAAAWLQMCGLERLHALQAICLRSNEYEEDLRRLTDRLRAVSGAPPAPRPRYRDERMRETSERAAVLRHRHRIRVREQVLCGSEATAEQIRALEAELLEVKRQLREGPQLLAGDCLSDQFLLVEEIGRGGFATVWKAFDEVAQRDVALKVLHGQYADSREYRERFQRGAKAMHRVDHPHIVRILEPYREDRGYHYFVMEYLVGGTFLQAVLSNKLTQDQVCQIILEVGDALTCAHGRGLIHRDVTPDNILLHGDGPTAKLTDFDLVCMGDSTGGTRTGALGKFVYAAPECLESAQDADNRCDVFSLGMTALFGFFGQRLPWEAFTLRHRFLPRLALPANLEFTLERAIEHEPKNRFSSAEEFCTALREAWTRKTAPVPPADPPTGRHREISCLVVLSEAERTTDLKLTRVVEEALKLLLQDRGHARFAIPECRSATEATVSGEAFVELVRKLCEAEVAVFDITHQEPSVMLLLGIRAVVRRGITILSLGENISPDGIPDLPFHLKNANIASHARDQARSLSRPPWRQLCERITAGLAQTGSAEYHDLPVYDAVRNLPAGERDTIPAEQCVFALVPFGPRYVAMNWASMLRPALCFHQDRHLRQKGSNIAPRYGVVRGIDIDSPHPVSSVIYGFIRRAALCIADWTDWSPDVFFALGVRLAAGQGRTACVIDRTHLAVCHGIPEHPEKAESWAREMLSGAANDTLVARLQATASQCLQLASLFGCREYDPAKSDGHEFDWVFQERSDAGVIAECRAAIGIHLDGLGEPASVPVHRELLQSALRFATDATKAVSPVLFVENAQVRRASEQAARERLLAAWKALTEDYTVDDIIADDLLTHECLTLINHMVTDPRYDPALLAQLRQLYRTIRR